VRRVVQGGRNLHRGSFVQLAGMHLLLLRPERFMAEYTYTLDRPVTGGSIGRLVIAPPFDATITALEVVDGGDLPAVAVKVAGAHVGGRGATLADLLNGGGLIGQRLQPGVTSHLTVRNPHKDVRRVKVVFRLASSVKG